MWYENTFFTCLSFIFENIYYISGIALFLVGIKQITLSKKQSIIKNQREAVTLSVIQCEMFASEIAPLAIKISEVLITAGIDLNKVINSLPEGNRNPFSLPEATYMEMFKKVSNEKLLNEYYELANRLEAFSTYFVSGIAHSETAYKTLGRAYCSNITSISPILSSSNSKQNSYLHIKELYSLWQNKLDVEKAQTAFIIASSKDKQHFETIGTR